MNNCVKRKTNLVAIPASSDDDEVVAHGGGGAGPGRAHGGQDLPGIGLWVQGIDGGQGSGDVFASNHQDVVVQRHRRGLHNNTTGCKNTR
jgi:hypothetical protein